MFLSAAADGGVVTESTDVVAVSPLVTTGAVFSNFTCGTTAGFLLATLARATTGCDDCSNSAFSFSIPPANTLIVYKRK